MSEYIFGQSTAGRPAVEEKPEPRGLARRVGEKLLGAQEQAQLSYVEKQALKRDQARPALERAIRRLRQAERDLATARIGYEAGCAALVLGDLGERAVAAVEREIEKLECDVRRYSAASRELERRLGVIRDPSGRIL